MHTRLLAFVAVGALTLGLSVALPALARDDGGLFDDQATIPPGYGNICDFSWSACFRRPVRP